MLGSGGTRWPLCGRDEEQELVLNELRPPTSGASVVLLGAAGVGKTRLLRELAAAVEPTGRPVRWVVGSPLAEEVPLGALAEFLPPEMIGTERAALAAHARRALAAPSDAGTAVVFVDDAHQLDEQSAMVIHQLCMSSAVAVVCAARSHVPARVLTSVCRDERTLVLELQPLGPADVDEVLELALGGAVAPSTSRLFYDRSAGTALFLRELLDDALRCGALTQGADGWRVDPQWSPSGRLVELVQARLARDDGGGQLALELVATGEPLGLGLLLDLAPEGAVVSLERDRILEVRRDGRRSFVAFAHPLYRTAVRAGLGALASRTHGLALASAIEGRGARRRGDLLAMALWRVDGGDLPPGAWLLAAQRAFALRHPATTSLAQRAVDAEGVAMAWVVLGESRAVRRDLDGALAAFAAGRRLARTDAEVAAVVSARAQASFWLGHEVASIVTELEAAEGAVADPVSRARLAVQRVSILTNSGRTSEGVKLAERLLSEGNLDRSDQRRVQSVTANGLAFLGETGRARAMGQDLLAAASGDGPESPFVMMLGAVNVISADLLGGEILAADAMLREVRTLVRNPETAGFLAALHGRIALFRGKPRDALAMFAEGAEGLASGVSPWRSAWCDALRNEAAALLGLPSEPVAPVTGATGELAHRFLAMDAVRANAVRLATLGDLPEARALLREATSMATSCELWSAGILCAYEQFRYGDEGGGEGVLALAGRVDGPWARVLGAHVRAWKDDDHAGLEAAAGALLELGADLFAAECAADAARSYDRLGNQTAGRRLTTLARQLRDRCQGCWSPRLGDLEAVTELTRREHEIALMAAAGLSNREIADRLTIGVRTVEGHLLRIYAKLGVGNRAALARVFVPSR